MIKNSIKQQGSALIIIMIVLAVGLIAALGFIFWQNMTKSEVVSEVANTNSTSESSNDNETETKTSDNSLFKNEKVSFEYPKSWERIPFGFTQDSDLSGYYPLELLKSSDYETDVSDMIVQSGATVQITIDNDRTAEDFQDEIDELQTYSYITFSSNRLVDGVDAYQYTTNYEGVRQTTQFIKNGSVYSIQMRQAASDGQSAYDMIRDSWKWL